MLQPHEEQMTHRGSIRLFVSRQVRKAMGARVFETGLQALRCFLPDDSMKLSVVLWRGHAANWHVTLSDVSGTKADSVIS